MKGVPLKWAESVLGLVESPDDLRDTLREVAQHARYWLFVDAQGGLIESYIRGQKGIAFRRREGVTWGKPCQDGFVLQSSECSQETTSPNHDVVRSDNWLGDDKALMLSQNVELVQRVENRIASSIRLERFDRGDFNLGKPLFAFDACQGINHFLMGSEDWKVRRFTRFFAIATGESGGEQIESASDGVEDCPSLDIKTSVERLAWYRYDKFLRRVRIVLGDEFVLAFPVPSQESVLEGWDLGFGPIDSGLSV